MSERDHTFRNLLKLFGLFLLWVGMLCAPTYRILLEGEETGDEIEIVFPGWFPALRRWLKP